MKRKPHCLAEVRMKSLGHILDEAAKYGAPLFPPPEQRKPNGIPAYGGPGGGGDYKHIIDKAETW